MAVIEKDGLYQYIDENGNIYILYPVTKLENVTGAGKLIQSPDGKTLVTIDGTNIAFVSFSDLVDYAKKTDLEAYATTKALDDLATATGKAIDNLATQARKELDNINASANAESRVEFVSNVLKTIGGTTIDMGNAKIAMGTYQGTGTYGVNNPNSLTFDFKPKLLIFLYHTSASNGSYISMMSLNFCETTYTPVLKVGNGENRGTLMAKFSDDGKTLSWYSEYSADAQCNLVLNTYASIVYNSYHYFALG